MPGTPQGQQSGKMPFTPEMLQQKLYGLQVNPFQNNNQMANATNMGDLRSGQMSPAMSSSGAITPVGNGPIIN